MCIYVLTVMKVLILDFATLDILILDAPIQGIPIVGSPYIQLQRVVCHVICVRWEEVLRVRRLG